MLNRALRGRRVGLALAAAAVAAGVWAVGPPAPDQAGAGPYIGLMCSDVTDAHFHQLGNTITCIVSLGGHAPRSHVNSWRLCVAGPTGVDTCRTSTSACPWVDGHTPPRSGGNCGHSCRSVWPGYTGLSGVSCSFVSHYDTPHRHVGVVLGTRIRPSCPSGQHRDGGSGSCHGHPRPTCTADGTYTTIVGTGHGTATTAVCVGPPPRCAPGQHRDGGSGSCHGHPRPTCTASGTYTAISGNGHTTATTAVCAPAPCPAGEHRDGGSGSCHSHPLPTCTADGTYTAISGNGHTTATTAVCAGPGPDPDPDPDPDPPCSTGLSLSASDRALFLSGVGWETLVDIRAQGPPGELWPPHPDVPGGSEFLVVARSPVWSVVDPLAQWTVPSADGCVWEVTTIGVSVSQMVPWRAGHRSAIEAADAARPGAGFGTYLTRWDNLSATQRSQARQYHVSRDPSNTCDIVEAQDPALARTQCSWALPWAGVWRWRVRACFEGVTDEDTYSECAVLDSGVEWFLNIVDYTQQITLLADDQSGS